MFGLVEKYRHTERPQTTLLKCFFLHSEPSLEQLIFGLSIILRLLWWRTCWWQDYAFALNCAIFNLAKIPYSAFTVNCFLLCGGIYLFILFLTQDIGVFVVLGLPCVSIVMKAISVAILQADYSGCQDGEGGRVDEWVDGETNTYWMVHSRSPYQRTQSLSLSGTRARNWVVPIGMPLKNERRHHFSD